MEKPKLQELRTMHAVLCQAIADPTRIALLYELGEGPKHVSDLVEALGLPQATVSRHLKVLRDRSLVHSRREGLYIYYQLAYPQVLEALNIMRAIMTEALNQQHSLAQSAVER